MSALLHESKSWERFPVTFVWLMQACIQRESDVNDW